MSSERRRYDLREVLSANIKALMEHDPLLTSQSEVARRCGIPQRSVGRILNGETQANLSTIVGIATAFGVEPWQMLVPGLDPTNLPRLHYLPEEQALALQKISKAIGEITQMTGVRPLIEPDERKKTHAATPSSRKPRNSKSKGG